MEVTGTIASQKISENEFSYWWCIPEFLSGYSYRSPKFGSICEEFFDCHLEIKTHIGQQQISRFFLCNSKDRNETKFTFSASLEHGIHPKPKGIYSIELYDLKPYVKIFAMSPSQHVFHPYFIFMLNLKLRKDFTTTTSFSKSNVSFQDIEEKSGTSYDPAKKEAIVKDDEDTKENDPVTSNAFEGESKFHSHIQYSEKLIHDLRSLYTSEAMSDLDIRIGEHILRAHKLILCARSPVFKAMMEHDCLESSSNSITITDCPAPPFDKFLKYLYTGEIEDETIDTVITLYSLSDKYDVPVLREASSIILHNKLSLMPVDEIANIVCNVLQLAEIHNDSKLKDLASSFIVNHFSVVSNKQDWKDLMKSNFELTSEILALVVNACQKIQT